MFLDSPGGHGPGDDDRERGTKKERKLHMLDSRPSADFFL